MRHYVVEVLMLEPLARLEVLRDTFIYGSDVAIYTGGGSTRCSPRLTSSA
jgi:hypothetical protein